MDTQRFFGKRIFISVITALLTILLGSTAAFADSPYDYYEYSTDNYNGLIWSTEYVGNAMPAPAAYVVDRIIDNKNLGIEVPFCGPEDFCQGPDGAVYILDSGDMEKGNGRIVVLEPDLSKVRYIISAYDLSGQKYNFRGARGLFVTKNNNIYVCDTLQARILSFEAPTIQSGIGLDLMDLEVKLKKIYEKPVIGDIKDKFDYKPISLVVDRSERLFVVSEGVFDGLISLDSDGRFNGFVGSNRINPSIIDLMWRQFATEEQIEKQVDFIPVEFSSVAIDKDGFIYTTARGDAKNQMVRKLNLAGTDVLRRGALPINGDISALISKGTPGTGSTFIDVSIGQNGMYSCLDSERGRIFTYDNDGNMIFAVGGLQSQEGSFKKPVATLWSGDKLIVLDKDYGEITVFRKTEYGNFINNAVEHQYKGEFEEAWEDWQEVLNLNSNNQFAQISVGKALYNQGKYAEAMKHFRKGNSQLLYSRAYAKIRKQKVEKIMPFVFILIAAVFLISAVWSFLKYIKEIRSNVKLFFETARKRIKRTEKKGVNSHGDNLS